MLLVLFLLLCGRREQAEIIRVSPRRASGDIVGFLPSISYESRGSDRFLLYRNQIEKHMTAVWLPRPTYLGLQLACGLQL